ncbi:cytidine deaminase-like protein [Catenaria anguillulae PL171]|uniref:Cytidine deaminase-like protein n=1 Tax=Catenaria anguillulae PL171 TaxID=765915 RepID=A0A1Y2HH01_9FUNG|nr:cytidine deaminase-like protein [Catenaria anguillulae PL171]
MLAALGFAQEALDVGEVPVGCVFVHNGHILAGGRNYTNETSNASRHAELVAIDLILKSHPPSIFASTDLYVTVEPCVMCASALRQLGLRRVYFGCGNDRFGGCGSVLNVHAMPTGLGMRELECFSGYLRDEAIVMLRQFYLRENETAPKPRKKANRTLKTDDIDPNALAVMSSSASSSPVPPPPPMS